jgi:predicted lipid-binding transport protein (Tim44 family)
MLGGFLLGGLLGSLLFGGGGLGLGGGFGLLDLLVVGGLAFLLISFFRRRAPQPAMAGGGAAGPAWMPSGDPPATAGPAVAPAPASTADDEDLARGIAHIQAMDPSFEPASFLAMARDLFTRLQIGWSGGDLAAVRAHLTDEMAVGLEQDLTRLRAQGRANRVEQVQVTAIALTEAWQEYGRDLVTVRITASALDYTVDATTGAVTEGSRTAPVSFTEYWTLARPVGPNPWKVSAIQQPPA